MIEVNYNEYKETIAENMQLIVKNRKLLDKIADLKHTIDDLHSQRARLEKQVDGLVEQKNSAIKYINKEFVFSDGTLGEADIKLLDILEGKQKYE